MNSGSTGTQITSADTSDMINLIQTKEKLTIMKKYSLFIFINIFFYFLCKS